VSVRSSVERFALRPQEAAAALGVSVRTIHRWIAAGALRSARVGGARLIPAQEIRRFLGETNAIDPSIGGYAGAESEWAERFTNDVLG
jgi:excisionase family DNA binding protein